MSMRTALLWMFMLVFGAFGVYMVKYKVQAIKKEVAQTEKQLFEERSDIHVLNAEWTYLNRPERLKALSAKYLDVKPTRGQQISELSSIPYGKSDSGVKQAAASSAGGGAVKLISGGTANENYGDE